MTGDARERLLLGIHALVCGASQKELAALRARYANNPDGWRVVEEARALTPAGCRCTAPPDCGSSSCRYTASKAGMRTNGHCRCDECAECGRAIRPPFQGPAHTHQLWCSRPDWIPAHHRAQESSP